MGYKVAFIAFDKEPKLSDVAGLERFRLYKRKGRSEWYLEGPSARTQGVSFLERPTLNVGEVSTWRAAEDEMQFLKREIEKHGGKTYGLDYKLMPIALALSAALRIRLLMVSSDDDELDSGFICSNGRLVTGRLIVGDDSDLVLR